MRLPNNPSVLAQVKLMLHKVPLGTSLTIHDLMRAFPKAEQSALSASLSTLAANRYCEIEDSKVFSVFKDERGQEIARHLKSYKLVEYPETDLRAKPVFTPVEKAPEPRPLVYAKDIPIKSGEKYDRVFALNPNMKFETEPLLEIGKELIYISDFPVLDSHVGERARSKYEWTMVHRLKDFNPVRDVVAIFGDSMVLGMVMFYLGSKQIKRINLSRFSMRDKVYVTREIAIDNFAM